MQFFFIAEFIWSRAVTRLMHFLPLQDSQWLSAARAKMATRAAANICVAAHTLQERSALVAHHFPTKSAKKRKSRHAMQLDPKPKGLYLQ